MGEQRSPRRRRTVVAIAVVAILLVVLVGPAVVMAGRVHPLRVPIDDSPDRLGLSFEEVEFGARDGVQLRGWYIAPPTPTDRAIVLAHGIDSNRLQNGVALPLAAALVERGFAVVLFDLRSSGISGDAAETLGSHERWDVLGAVDLARTRGARHVGVIGYSMGAVASIYAALDDRSIEALVTDSAYADLHETLARGMGRSFLLPAPLAEYPLLWFRILTGVDPRSVVPAAAIGGIAPRPVLIIHGTADETVPPSDSERLLAGASSPTAERWLVPGGRHTLGYEAAPDEYVRRVASFFDAHLGS
jgi:dipeptidyl aminopeptidase/acylaminoacyl peptidase